MEKYKTPKVNQTSSIPLEISNHGICKELEAKKNQLRKEYADIKKDKGQLRAMKDWESTGGDGLDDW